MVVKLRTGVDPASEVLDDRELVPYLGARRSLA